MIMHKLKSMLGKNDFSSNLLKLSYFSGGNLIARFFMLGNAILVARALGPNLLGIYSGLYAFLSVLITFVNFGQDLWFLKEAHNYSLLEYLAGKIILIKLILGLIIGALSLIILPITHPKVFAPSLILLAIGDVVSENTILTIYTYWNIRRHIKLINFMLFLSNIGRITLLLLLINTNHVSPLTIVGSRFIVSFTVLFISITIMKPIIVINKINEYFAILKKSTAYGVSNILAMIYAKIDVVILSFYSINNTGFYSPASGIVQTLFVIPNSIFTFLLPKYSESISNQKKIPSEKTLKRIIYIFIIIGSILSITLYLIGPYVIELILGKSYYATSELLKILSPILFFKSISFGAALLIIITGNQRKRLIPQFIVTLFNIILNIILIPYFGLTAIGWIYTASEFLLMLGYILIIIKIFSKENRIQST